MNYEKERVTTQRKTQRSEVRSKNGKNFADIFGGGGSAAKAIELPESFAAGSGA